MVDDFNPFLGLTLAALAWFLLHKGVAGSPLRGRLVARLGERGFRGLFSLASLASLSWLFLAYRAAPCSPLWTLPRSALWLPSMVMPLSFLLLVGAFSVPNPTGVGGESALKRGGAVRGVLRITRHPFLWAVVLWSASHLIVNGNVSAALFFGSMLATAVFGTRDIDRKRIESDEASFAPFAASTSNVPFAAILSGRNTLELRELLLPGAIGSALTALMLGFHHKLFNVSPFP
jgi:uncharacterized membrane protein